MRTHIIQRYFIFFSLFIPTSSRPNSSQAQTPRQANLLQQHHPPAILAGFCRLRPLSPRLLLHDRRRHRPPPRLPFFFRPRLLRLASWSPLPAPLLRRPAAPRRLSAYLGKYETHALKEAVGSLACLLLSLCFDTTLFLPFDPPPSSAAIAEFWVEKRVRETAE